MAMSMFRLFLTPVIAFLMMASASLAQDDRTAEIEATTQEIASLRETVAEPGAETNTAESLLRDLRQGSRQQLTGVDHELNAIRDQLNALGPAPGEGDPPETADLAAQRAALNEELARANSQRVRINANIAEANQLLGEIANMRVQSLYERLFSRGASLASPALWSAASEAAGEVAQKTGAFFADWAQEKRSQDRLGVSIIAITLAFGVSLFLFWPVNRWIMATFADAISRRKPTTGRRVVAAGLKMIARAVPGVIGGFIMIETLRAQGILTEAGESAARIFWLVLIDYLLVSGFLSGLFAPRNPAWRIAPIDAARGRTAGALIIAIVIVFGVKVLLHEIFAIENAAEALMRLSDAIAAFIIGCLLYALCRKSFWFSNKAGATVMGSPEDQAALADLDKQAVTRSARGADWWRFLRRSGRAVALFMLVAVIVGYTSLADFIASRVYYLALILALAWFFRALLREGVFLLRDKMEPAESRSQSEEETASDNFRFWTNWLINTVLFFMLAPVALMLAGVPAQNVVDIGVQALFGFRIGGVQIPSIAKIFYAVVIFIAVLMLTRLLQRAIQKGPFEHSKVDIGVQNSLITLMGYIGLVIALFVSISSLGFDLGNLALIAGALSVGIGFGLQSIVNNFVSGLILLFERPIKVGDWIVTTSGEGTVRKISVRSTEIETFDRSSIIVPNSELISSTVTNWTHKNKIGRVIVPVGVAYGEDPEKVREILIRCAKEHPLVVSYPEPFVTWQDFGSSSLDFDLRAFLNDISKGLSVRTDLRFAIFQAFKEEGIEIPFPQQDVYIKSFPGRDQPQKGEGSDA